MVSKLPFSSHKGSGMLDKWGCGKDVVESKDLLCKAIIKWMDVIGAD